MSATDQHVIPLNYHEFSPLEKRVAAANAVLVAITALASGGADRSSGQVENLLTNISPLIDALQDAINVSR